MKTNIPPTLSHTFSHGAYWLLKTLGLGFLCMAIHADPVARHVVEIDVPYPAFLDIHHRWSPYGSTFLSISSFSMAPESDKVSVIYNLAGLLNQELPIKIETLTDKITWPNQLTTSAYGVPIPTTAIVSSGFLIPSKDIGAINILNTLTHQTVKVSNDQPGWFYHRTVLYDMNADGRLDIVTAKTNRSISDPNNAMLVWLQHPETNHSQAWKEHVIASGPDVSFVLVDLNHDFIPEFVTTEFFNQKLSLIWKESNQWVRKVIDDDLGNGFDLSPVDLNNDGRVDILASNHQSDEKAGVFAYEIPLLYKQQAWKKHTLIDGIITRQDGAGQASPGKAQAFYPSPEIQHSKPWVHISGDGSKRSHLLIPCDQQPDHWCYTETVLLQSNHSVIGQSAIEDVNGDGYAEIFVPLYEEGKIQVFTFSPD